MATTEEKQDLVDTLSGPRFYRIQLLGYGGESAYMGISKEAYEFWSAQEEEHGDGDLVNYMLNAEDGDFDFQEIQEVPSEAQFLHDEDGEAWPWFESPREFEHTFGVELGSAHLTVEEVSSHDYDADHVADIVDSADLSEYLDNVMEENNYEIDLIDYECCDESPEPYVAQMYSSEKGCFFSGIVETVGAFDPKKLSIKTVEYLNGEDTVIEVLYDGEEVDNDGGDTNGKGYFASVWAN